MVQVGLGDAFEGCHVAVSALLLALQHGHGLTLPIRGCAQIQPFPLPARAQPSTDTVSGGS